MTKLHFTEKHIHNTITLVVGDEGRIADEVLTCLKNDINEHLESQADAYVQTLTDKARGK